MNLKKEKKENPFLSDLCILLFCYFAIGIVSVLSILLYISIVNPETESGTNEEKIVPTYCDMVLIADETFSGNGAVYYDKNTKVMYYVLHAGQSRNGITPIYNSDGSLKLYEYEE